MKKNEIFTFTAPNEVEVTAVVIDCCEEHCLEQTMNYQRWCDKYLCYAQNRLFYHTVWTEVEKVVDDDFIPSCDEENDWYYAILYHSHDVKTTDSSQEILVDYCILPDYDAMLENYYHQQDKANDYADKTL